MGNTDPKRNFCAQWSGALGFLDNGSSNQEVHVQLYRLYPCCPTTLYSLGDVRETPVLELLDRVRAEETFQSLNQGDIFSLGKDTGLSSEFVQARIEALGDVCLWCDEFFEKYYRGTLGERRR